MGLEVRITHGKALSRGQSQGCPPVLQTHGHPVGLADSSPLHPTAHSGVNESLAEHLHSVTHYRPKLLDQGLPVQLSVTQGIQDEILHCHY